MNDQLGTRGFRSAGSHFEELADTNRLVMFVRTHAAQIFAVLEDTLTVYLIPRQPDNK